ncbi:uncharacterized protein METZ01_LOCUS89304 [marine metagenome]|uniref:Uncharacterized protein n=1 Tax=marine metagenome TaxID=408172 RepID=A0A381V830_9ZZZZ
MDILEDSIEPFCILDRTKYFWNYINFNYDYAPMPALDLSINESVDEYFEIIAKEYVNKYSEIYLLWSGGIDSTAVLVSLMKARKSKNQLIVFYTSSSIEEYPWFYNEYKNEIKFELIDRSIWVGYWLEWRLKYKNNYILLDGIPGDQLFTTARWVVGSNDSSLLANPKWHQHKIFKGSAKHAKRDWHDMLLDNSFTFGKNIYEKQLVIDMMDEHIDHNNIHISNAYHFFWWLIFCFGFHKMTCNFAKHENTFHFNHKGFYNHKLMQKWSMYVHHKNLLPMENISDHKLPFKDYIYKFTNDSNYKDNKEKKASTELWLNDAWEKKLNLLDNNNNYIRAVEETDLSNYVKYLNENKVKINIKKYPNKSIKTLKNEKIIWQENLKNHEWDWIKHFKDKNDFSLALKLCEENAWIARTLGAKKERRKFKSCKTLILVGSGFWPYSLFDIYKQYPNIKKLIGIDYDKKCVKISQFLVKESKIDDRINIICANGKDFDYTNLNHEDLVFLSCDIKETEDIFNKILTTSRAGVYICEPKSKWITNKIKKPS